MNKLCWWHGGCSRYDVNLGCPSLQDVIVAVSGNFGMTSFTVLSERFLLSCSWPQWSFALQSFLKSSFAKLTSYMTENAFLSFGLEMSLFAFTLRVAHKLQFNPIDHGIICGYSSMEILKHNYPTKKGALPYTFCKWPSYYFPKLDAFVMEKSSAMNWAKWTSYRMYTWWNTVLPHQLEAPRYKVVRLCHFNFSRQPFIWIFQKVNGSMKSWLTHVQDNMETLWMASPCFSCLRILWLFFFVNLHHKNNINNKLILITTVKFSFDRKPNRVIFILLWFCRWQRCYYGNYCC